MTSPITSNSMSWLIQYKLKCVDRCIKLRQFARHILPYWDLSRCLLCRLCFYNPMAPVLMHTCFFNIFLQFWWYWCSLLLSWLDWWNEILDRGFAINSRSGIFGDDCLNLANAEQEQFVLTLTHNSIWIRRYHGSNCLDRVLEMPDGGIHVCMCVSVYICMYIFDITGRVSWAWLCFWWC